MSHENKAGLLVSIAFVCMAGAVVYLRMNDNPPPQETADASSAELPPWPKAGEPPANPSAAKTAPAATTVAPVVEPPRFEKPPDLQLTGGADTRPAGNPLGGGPAPTPHIEPPAVPPVATREPTPAIEPPARPAARTEDPAPEPIAPVVSGPRHGESAPALEPLPGRDTPRHHEAPLGGAGPRMGEADPAPVPAHAPGTPPAEPRGTGTPSIDPVPPASHSPAIEPPAPSHSPAIEPPAPSAPTHPPVGGNESHGPATAPPAPTATPPSPSPLGGSSEPVATPPAPPVESPRATPPEPPPPVPPVSPPAPAAGLTPATSGSSLIMPPPPSGTGGTSSGPAPSPPAPPPVGSGSPLGSSGPAPAIAEPTHPAPPVGGTPGGVVIGPPQTPTGTSPPPAPTPDPRFAPPPGLSALDHPPPAPTPTPPPPVPVPTAAVVPPVGAPPAVASPPIPVPVPGSGIVAAPAARPPTVADPRVESFDEETYICKANETFKSICQQRYTNDKYEQALIAFNRAHPMAAEGVRAEPPALRAGEPVYVPPLEILQKRYRSLIPEVPGRPAGSGAAAPATGAPLATPATRTYTVQGRPETFYEIAQKMLGRADRWGAIWDLNREHANPNQPLAAGTTIRLPVE